MKDEGKARLGFLFILHPLSFSLPFSTEAMGRFARHGWVVVLAALLWPLGCAHRARPRPLEGVPVVRVRLLQDQHLVTLTASRPPRVSLGGASTTPLDVPRNEAVPVRLTPQGWRVGDATFPSTGPLTIQPEADGTVAINGTPYRGRYRFVPTSQGFDVVNDVDVDGYLKSVVSKELLWYWHDEAYRAQAIAARTYALYEAAGDGRGHYDVNDDVRSQVYGGMPAESAKSREAVDATAGVVVAHKTDQGYKIFKAYFSSCCGGTTSSAADAFNEPNIKPLSARYVGPVCKDSPRFSWGPIVMSKADLTRRFKAWGSARGHAIKDMTDLAAVDVLTANEFGRPTRFLVTDAKGTRYALSGEEFRWSVNTGGVVLNSSFVKPINEATTVRFAEGHGWGHGVGMCQWCAQAYAEAGMAHEDIVLRSFPGTALKRAY
jgi:stage II sporulation protein D